MAETILGEDLWYQVKDMKEAVVVAQQDIGQKDALKELAYATADIAKLEPVLLLVFQFISRMRI